LTSLIFLTFADGGEHYKSGILIRPRARYLGPRP